MEWISVDERLPSVGETVILFDNGVVQKTLFTLDAGDVSDFVTEYFWSFDDDEEGVDINDSQYWMPLPEPPK